MRWYRIIALLVSLWALTACAHSPTTASEPVRFTVLHTNDHHGRFWRNDDGEYGLSAQKTLVDSIRAEVQAQGGRVLLLSGGDINTGVPASDLQDAEPDFRGMRMIGYDAMALGNHEFDNPPEVLARQAEWAGFPLLSANIYQAGSGQHAYQPYALFDLGGIEVAVIGLTTEDTPRLVNGSNTAGLEFRDPKREARRMIEQLEREAKPDVIIAATHMGHYDNGEHGANAPGDVELARSLPAGALAMIVGGHSQDPVCMEEENRKDPDYLPSTPCAPDRQNGTWIVQAHEWGKYVGRADFVYRDGTLELERYRLIPVNLGHEVEGNWVLFEPHIPESADMLALLAPYQERAGDELKRRVGEVDARLEGNRAQVRSRQTDLAQLILAAFIERADADLAVLNGGGIRDSVEAGEISYEALLRVHPFANQLAYVDLDGAELTEYLATVSAIPPGSGGYAQLRGVGRLEDGRFTIDGEPLDSARRYRLATLDFAAQGGDGYPMLSQHPSYVDTGFTDAQVVRDYVERHSPLRAADFVPAGL
ncbi:bifunctional UDP-sugar hydrolase/5'-nucleotidase UshA [Halotalea alkalilenta]|uniref:bifunctional UDP-sugar hydrolase/5'-nucleotidase UshA n=1 Tax=Halotalea alkalilenta TaxID=376489 RepID=UPI000481285C|nr:bifunctional UDP-sugar hydrolase/5'-nucleotidase UshA [Halotalea alkalilenta]